MSTTTLPKLVTRFNGILHTFLVHPWYLGLKLAGGGCDTEGMSIRAILLTLLFEFRK